jgi:hypothetical protein
MGGGDVHTDKNMHTCLAFKITQHTIFVLGKSIIDALAVKCGNASSGCEWTGTVGTLSSHVPTCSFLKVDASPHTPGRQSSETDLKCYVFVDYPNLWVAGQKESGKQLIDTNTDPRFRVELGKLLQLVTNNRQISKSFFYGSNSQALKATAKEKGFIIKNYDGFAPNAAMARDILLSLITLSFVENKENVVFIVITGDSKFRPLLEVTIHQGVPVELWSWRDAMSHEFPLLAHTCEKFTAKYLDSISDKFSFTHFMSTRDKKDIDPSHAIVYRDVPVDDCFLKTLINHLKQLKRLFYITSVKKDLIVEFPESNPDVVFNEVRKLKNFPHQPCSYPEYTQKKEKVKQTPTKNRFGALRQNSSEAASNDNDHSSKDPSLESTAKMDDSTTSEGHYTSQEKGEKDTESSDDWKMELRRRPGKMTQMKRRKEKPCTHGDHCPKAADDPYLHIEEDFEWLSDFQYTKRKYATRNPSTPLRRWRRKGEPMHTTKKTPGALNAVATITSLTTAPCGESTDHLNDEST